VSEHVAYAFHFSGAFSRCRPSSTIFLNAEEPKKSSNRHFSSLFVTPTGHPSRVKPLLLAELRRRRICGPSGVIGRNLTLSRPELHPKWTICAGDGWFVPPSADDGLHPFPMSLE
jgi:hypothetical protein